MDEPAQVPDASGVLRGRLSGDGGGRRLSPTQKVVAIHVVLIDNKGVLRWLCCRERCRRGAFGGARLACPKEEDYADDADVGDVAAFAWHTRQASIKCRRAIATSSVATSELHVHAMKAHWRHRWDRSRIRRMSRRRTGVAPCTCDIATSVCRIAHSNNSTIEEAQDVPRQFRLARCPPKAGPECHQGATFYQTRPEKQAAAGVTGGFVVQPTRTQSWRLDPHRRAQRRQHCGKIGDEPAKLVAINGVGITKRWGEMKAPNVLDHALQDATPAQRGETP